MKNQGKRRNETKTRTMTEDNDKGRLGMADPCNMVSVERVPLRNSTDGIYNTATADSCVVHTCMHKRQQHWTLLTMSTSRRDTLHLSWAKQKMNIL